MTSFNGQTFSPDRMYSVQNSITSCYVDVAIAGYTSLYQCTAKIPYNNEGKINLLNRN